MMAFVVYQRQRSEADITRLELPQRQSPHQEQIEGLAITFFGGPMQAVVGSLMKEAEPKERIRPPWE